MHILDRILNIIASYRINHIVFPKELAAKMPIYCSWHVKWLNIKKGSIEIQSDNIYKGMLQIGHARIANGIIGIKQSYINLDNNGKVIFRGPTDLSQGISIYAHDNGVITIGSGLYTNAYCSLFCNNEISIGDDCLIGWNVTIMDTDGHPIYDSDHNIINYPTKITIGNNVWLGSKATIMKGASIPDGCVVGRGSTVTRKETIPNSVLVGTPAKVIRQNITWSREGLKTL